MKPKDIWCPNCRMQFGLQFGQRVLAMGHNERWYVVEDVLMCVCSRCSCEWSPGNKPIPPLPIMSEGEKATPLIGVTPAGKQRILAQVYAACVWIEYAGRVLVARRLLSVDAPECSVIAGK